MFLPDTSESLATLLQAVSGEAGRQADAAEARDALKYWREVTRSDSSSDDDKHLFASEATLAACAKALLAHRIGDLEGLERCFPHLGSRGAHGWLDVPNIDALARKASHEEDGVEALGWLYQHAVPRAERKRRGHFYTPRPIVEAMLDDVQFDGAANSEQLLLDPACGSGAFLLGALRRMLKVATAKEEDPHLVCTRALSVLHGWDIDPLAVLLSEASIAFSLADRLAQADLSALPQAALHVTDSLQGRRPEAQDSDGTGANSAVNTTGDFTWVVGNPPYGKIPSRELTESQKNRFAATTLGHPNLYALFLQVGIESLTEHGRISFIVPRSFVGGMYFRNLRSYLHKQLDLQTFTTFTDRDRLFAGVLQDVVVLSGQRRRQDSRSSTVLLREFGDDFSKPTRQCRVPRKSVVLGKQFDHAFSLDPDPALHDLLSTVYADATSLGEAGVIASTGTVVWNRLRKQLRMTISAERRPLWWSNAIRPFSCGEPGNRYGEFAAVSLEEKTSRILSVGPGLLVKRMTAKEEPRRLVACRVPAHAAQHPLGYFAENHVNVMRIHEEADLDLDAVLGLLNSSLYDLIFRALNGNTQVSVSELRLMPIKRGPQLVEVANVARRLTDEGHVDGELFKRLDIAVCDLFDISTELRQTFGLPLSPATSASSRLPAAPRTASSSGRLGAPRRAAVPRIA